jgi:hypothetical protein
VGKKYKNSQIIEALCEFQFEQNPPWDLAIPGIIYLPSEMYSFYQERDTSTTFVSPLYVELIKQKYSIRGDAEVFHFLEVYPFLAQLLIEAYPYIRKYFPQSKISLEMVSDPEEYGREQLVAFIKTDMEPQEAVEALSNFDKMWWLNALKRAQGNLCITVEY